MDLIPANPSISVVMPVHNAFHFLDESISSILSQSLDDLELVILDGASTDGSLERLREWARRDPRIKLHESKKRLGPSDGSGSIDHVKFVTPKRRGKPTFLTGEMTRVTWSIGP